MLFAMVCRPLTPFRTRAAIRFSGSPHRPKPPNMTVDPSVMSASASSGPASTLFIVFSLFVPELINRYPIATSQPFHCLAEFLRHLPEYNWRRHRFPQLAAHEHHQPGPVEHGGGITESGHLRFEGLRRLLGVLGRGDEIVDLTEVDLADDLGLAIDALAIASVVIGVAADLFGGEARHR